jgi:hypothetical protein
VETWKEVFDFCSRKELGKGISLVTFQFNAIAEPIMHEEREHSLSNLVLDGSLELPTTDMPKNIVAARSIRIKSFFNKF